MKKGFTLIELLVVVSIIGILSTGAIVAFANFREERLAQREAQTIVNELRSAQRRALAGDKPSGCSNVSMQGYQVVFSTSSMAISALCSGGVATTTTVNLVGVISNPPTVTFKVLTGAAVPTSISICSYNRLYTVTINGVGSVQTPVKTSTC